MEKLNDAFPDFVDEADLSLDRILDSITASNLPLPNENTDVPHNDINSFDSFYQNKISETCDDILMLEKTPQPSFRPISKTSTREALSASLPPART